MDCSLIHARHLHSRSDRDVLPENVKPAHYDLTIKPDLVAFTFEGKVSIRLDILMETDCIFLNASELAFRDISLSYEGETILVKSYEFHQRDQVLEVKLGKMLLAGSRATLVIEFLGSLNDQMAGFYRSSYTDTVDGSKKYLAVTQFEATDARKAFPCWDEPAVKSKFTVNLIIPKTLTGLSNMDEESRKESEDGKSISIKFKESPIMSTYLVAWAVGDFEFVERCNEDGILVRVYAIRGHAIQGQFALEVATRALAFFSRYFDQPYPLPKMDMIAVPDLSIGAMENWGLVTFCTAYLLFDEKNSTIKTKQNVAYIVAHELAHQWFGNLVTMEWWNDLWLNEGFATWVGWLMVDFLFPEWDIWAEFVLSETQAGLALDGLCSSHPIEVPVKNPSEIIQIFDAISYSKSASVIRMLVKYLGEDSFQKGMRMYLSKHKYQNAKTSDLWAALSEASGQSAAEIMASWTHMIGYPILSIEATQEESRVTLQVTQNRFLNSGNVKEEQDCTIWSLPLNLVTDQGHGSENCLLNSRSLTIDLPAETTYFKFNYEQAGFYRVQYPIDWLEKLGKAVKQGKFGTSDRIGIVSDVFSLSIAGKLSICTVFDVLRFFENESDYLVWGVIILRLNEALSAWWEQDESTINNLKAFICGLCSRQVDLLGFDFKLSEDDKTKLLRPLIIGISGKCGNEFVLKESRVRFERFIAGDSDSIHPNLREVVFSLVIQEGNQLEFDQVLKLYKDFVVADQKLAALSALGSSRHASVVKNALDLSKQHNIVRPQDITVLLRTIGLNPSGRRLLWEFVKKNWDFFHGLYSCGGVLLLSGLVSCSAQEFSQNSDAEDVERFFSKRNISSIDRTVEQCVERIRSNADWLHKHKNELSQYLETYFN